MSQFGPDLDVVARLLQIEAKALARALGHAWSGTTAVVKGRQWRAYCAVCGASATIEPRAWTRVPLRGEMVALHCRPRPVECRVAGFIAYRPKSITHGDGI